MLPEMFQALLRPETYPEPTRKVTLVQTQMSFVFLTDKFVYKIKKPVNLDYLNYTTLDKRRFYCQKEVELNRRLCPDVYLGVVSITQHHGGFSIGGRSKAIEYAVKMNRLPQKRMMDTLLVRDQVSPEMLTRLAQRLAQFHHKAETNTTISAFGSPETISQNTEENFSQTEKYIGKTISGHDFKQIKDYTHSFIRQKAALLEKRVRDGRIRDGHGDLHTAHICFNNGICIYDCIEFNDRFRYGDIAAEVAFLAMDLDHYGRADLGRQFITTYTSYSRDKGLTKLLKFYKCYRAYVRGKVSSFKLDDAYISQHEKKQAHEIASSYFDLAHSYVKLKPSLFITVGLVGTGKSLLAQALGRRLGLVIISSDITRKHIASIPITEHHFEEFNTGIYSPEFSRRTYDTMFTEARSIISDGYSVIIDASFIKAKERLKAKRLAQEIKASFFAIECTLDEETIRKRLTQRFKRISASDGRWQIYQPQKKNFEPVVEIPAPSHIIIDASQPIRSSIKRILDLVSG